MRVVVREGVGVFCCLTFSRMLDLSVCVPCMHLGALQLRVRVQGLIQLLLILFAPVYAPLYTLQHCCEHGCQDVDGAGALRGPFARQVLHFGRHEMGGIGAVRALCRVIVQTVCGLCSVR